MLNEYRTDGPGKFEGESPMCRFLFERVVLHGFSDESTSDGQGTWLDRIGRRLIGGDSLGFVYYQRFETEDEARAAFERVEHDFALFEGDEF